MKWFAWRVAAAGVLVAIWIAAALSAPAFERVAFHAVAVFGLVGMGVGIRRHSSDRVAGWWLLLAGAGVSEACGIARDLLAWVGLLDSGEIIAAAGGVVGVLLYAAAARSFVVASTRGADRDGAIDGLVVAVVIGSSLWQYIVVPSTGLSDGFGSALPGIVDDVLVGVIYSLLPAAIAALSIRLVFLHPRALAAWILLSTNLLFLSANVVLVVAGGSALVLSVVLGSWLLCFLLLAIAALHPSMRQLTTPVDSDEGRLPFARLLVLGAALIGGQLLLFQQSSLELASVAAVGSLSTTLLVLWRLARVVAARERARRKAEAVAEVNRDLAQQQTIVARLGAVATSDVDAAALVEEVTQRAQQALTARVHRVTLDPPASLHASSEVTAGRTHDDRVEVVPVALTDRSLVVELRDGAQLREADVVFLESVAGVLSGGLRWRHAHDAAVQRSRRDALTGLPNRAGMLEHLEAAHADRTLTGVLFCDLDGFKEVNDTFGHEAGDQLLVEVARRLHTSTRAGDTVGRLAGDEFVVVVRSTTTAAVAAMVQRFEADLARPYTLRDATVHVTASVGYATCDDHDDTAAMLRAADAAMYEAKRQRAMAQSLS